MTSFLVRVGVTALVVAGVSELARKSTALAAVLASLPLTSILAMIWLYRDSGSPEKISEFSLGVFWAVLPSLLFFLVLPLLLRKGVGFVSALPLACAVMFVAYTGYVWVMGKMGVSP